MSPAVIAAVLGAVFGTSFLSGVFGMAGGMILKGVLVGLMSVSASMILHGLVQVVANGWRAWLWRGNICWPIVGRFALGMIPVVILFAWLRVNPSAFAVYLGLGLIPFVNEIVPKDRAPVIEQPGRAYICAMLTTSVQLVAGVTGPLLDVFFLRSRLERKQIVATKAATQVLGHLAKVMQFGVILSGFSGVLRGQSFPLWLPAAAVPLSMLGTSAAAPVLTRLSDKQFRLGMRVLLLGTGTCYLGRALVLGMM